MAYYVFSMIGNFFFMFKPMHETLFSLGMEAFQDKIVYSESGTSLDLVCNDIRLNGSEFAR